MTMLTAIKVVIFGLSLPVLAHFVFARSESFGRLHICTCSFEPSLLADVISKSCVMGPYGFSSHLSIIILNYRISKFLYRLMESQSQNAELGRL